MENNSAINLMNELLSLMVAKNGSDLFITVGFAPAIKVDGAILPVAENALTTEQTRSLVRALMNDRQTAEFETTKEVNFAIAPAHIGRFRVSAFVQQGCVGMVVRIIPKHVPTIAGLGLPDAIKELALTKRGLIIFVGGTGTGKTTSLAALLNHRNENTQGHIITIEDPIEFVHPHKKCIVTQREVGVDTDTWDAALKNALRQAPDVILMGEIRDRETMEHALAFSETGHLCLATLHANSANQAIDRIINFFSEERHQQLFLDLSLNLKAMISQRLLPKKDSKGRAAAIEIMINSPLISDHIANGKVAEIKDVMKKSRELGMQTFDQHLFDLYEDQQVSYEDALRFADSVNDLRLNIKLKSKLERDTAGDGSGAMSISPILI